MKSPPFPGSQVIFAQGLKKLIGRRRDDVLQAAELHGCGARGDELGGRNAMACDDHALPAAYPPNEAMGVPRLYLVGSAADGRVAIHLQGVSLSSGGAPGSSGHGRPTGLGTAPSDRGKTCVTARSCVSCVCWNTRHANDTGPDHGCPAATAAKQSRSMPEIAVAYRRFLGIVTTGNRDRRIQVSGACGELQRLDRFRVRKSEL